MYLQSKIVVKPKYSCEYDSDVLIRSMDNMLYNVSIGQDIQTYTNNKLYTMKVVGVFDSIYDDAIYRYIEVVVVDTKIN